MFRSVWSFDVIHQVRIRAQERRTKNEEHTNKMKITRFEDIEAWKAARELCRAVHTATSKGDFARQYSLKDQNDRASGLCMDNIAEGFDGGSNPEFIRFLHYAQRSCTEVQSQLYRAYDRKLIEQGEFDNLYGLATMTHKIIGGFIRYLKKSQTTR